MYILLFLCYPQRREVEVYSINWTLLVYYTKGRVQKKKMEISIRGGSGNFFLIFHLWYQLCVKTPSELNPELLLIQLHGTNWPSQVYSGWDHVWQQNNYPKCVCWIAQTPYQKPFHQFTLWQNSTEIKTIFFNCVA